MATNDMAVAIAAKSDQLNADDLMSGPVTVTITGARVDASSDQPVVLELEGMEGRPYKPGKSMSRVLVAAWGANSGQYVGGRLTLYRDPNVKFGGILVGGIRISHMSGLERPLHVPLTQTRGRKAVFTVQPLPDVPVASSGASLVSDEAILAATDKDALRGMYRVATGEQQALIMARVEVLDAEAAVDQ